MSPILSHCDRSILTPFTEGVSFALFNPIVTVCISPPPLNSCTSMLRPQRRSSNLFPWQYNTALCWPPKHLHVCRWSSSWWGDLQCHALIITLLNPRRPGSSLQPPLLSPTYPPQTPLTASYSIVSHLQPNYSLWLSSHWTTHWVDPSLFQTPGPTLPSQSIFRRGYSPCQTYQIITHPIGTLVSISALASYLDEQHNHSIDGILSSLPTPHYSSTHGLSHYRGGPHKYIIHNCCRCIGRIGSACHLIWVGVGQLHWFNPSVTTFEVNIPQFRSFDLPRN